MLRATLVALTLCAWCAAAEDLTDLLRSDRVQPVDASYPASKRLSESEVFGARVRARAPNDNCPTPTTCPQGFTGHYCDISMCTAKNPRPPPPGDNAIEIRTYAQCSSTNYFPVDSSIRDSIYIFVDTTVPNSNPSMTLYDPQGNVVNPTKVILNDTQTLEIQYPVNSRGMYSASFKASNPCIFQVHARSFMSVAVGFTMSLSNDFPTTDLQQFSYSYVVASHQGLLKPGRMFIIEIWENGVLQQSYDMRARFNCEYHMFAGPVICSQVNTYQFKAYGLDDNGYEWMRTDPVRCVQSGPTSPGTTATAPMTTPTPGTTTQGPPTSPNPCMNGGYPISGGGCLCPSHFTGDICQTIICANGGTGSGSTCTCPSGFTGQYCENAICTQTNPIQPIGPNQKSLVLVVQITSTMADDIRALKTYILELVDMFIEHHPQFLTSFGLVVFNDKYDAIGYTGNDYNAFISAVHTFFQMSGPGTCKKPVLAGVQQALKLSQYGGSVYVFTDSPYSDDSSVLIDVFTRAERMATKVTFFVTPNYQTDCIIPIPLLTAYSDIAAFSGGDYFHLASKRSVQQAIQIMPTAYMSARVLEHQYDDCTNVQELFVAVDSHTSAFTVVIEGNLAAMATYEPQGTAWMSSDDLLNDVNVKVSHVITPCEDGWAQHGFACYQGVAEPASWTDAQADCQSKNAHMVNVLSGAKQTFLNYELHGADIWTGLNDRVQERNFMWDGPRPLKLDTYWTNWAPGEPALGQDKDCVSIMHIYVNNTLQDARWFTRRCDEKRMYACQKHAFDSNRHRLPAGFWKVAVVTKDSGQPNGKACKVLVRAQTDLQVYTGFANSTFSDYPNLQPSAAGGNYAVANVGGRTNNFGHIDGIDFHALNGTQLMYSKMMPRTNCFYQFVTVDAFKCPAQVFSMSFFGHDENGYQFNRVRDAICLSSISEYLSVKGHI